MMTCGIYKITHKRTNKCYIGQSIHIERRWQDHINSSLKQKDNFYIHCAIKKYGEDAFNFEIIEKLPQDKLLLNEREEYWINYYKSNKKRYGYNLTTGGAGARCDKRSVDKRTATFKRLFGVSHPMQNKKIKEKLRNTFNERYGVNAPFEIQSTREKALKTNKEKYGYEYPMKNKKVAKKLSKTFALKYGYDWVTQVPEIKEKIKQTFLKKYNGSPMKNPEILKKALEKCYKKGIYKTIKNIETGKIFLRHEAEKWLNTKHTFANLDKYLKGKYKHLGKIPKDEKIDRSLWGKQAHWEIVSYDEYIKQKNKYKEEA